MIPEYYHNLSSIAKQKNIIPNFKYYWKILLLIGIFYGIPAVQYVLYQVEFNSSLGYNDLVNKCYFNFKCNHKVGPLWAFNNVISNIGYIIYGLLYIGIVYFSKTIEINGLIQNKHLYYALGLSLFFEGIFSSAYHVCPNALNFQFDTTFMFIGSILMFITILQKKKTYKIIGIFKAYTIMALCNIFNVIELSKYLSWYGFWYMVVILYILISGYLCLKLYHSVQNESTYMNKNIFSIIRNISYEVLSCKIKIKQKIYFAYLSTLNIISIAILILSIIFELHFFTFVLSVFFINIFIVMLNYMIIKIKRKEKIDLKTWVFFILSLCCNTVAIYYFEQPSTDKFLTPQESLLLNSDCILWNYFDTHDIWHMMSATGIFFLLLSIWYIDNNKNFIHSYFDSHMKNSELSNVENI